MVIRNLFNSMNISASGLYAQRTKINIISENIANAETTRTETGEPYRRKLAVMKSGMDDKEIFSQLLKESKLKLEKSDGKHFPEKPFRDPQGIDRPGVRVGQIAEDMSDFKMVYDPAHPDADEDGYVKMPNVNVVQEMTELINATRAFEANITAINSSKDMIKKSLKI